MHVTDWFPTILSWAGINYRADTEAKKLDGLNQAAALSQGGANPREFLLYNAIINVEGKNLDMKTNAPVAVRDKQYKLIHAFTENPSAGYYDTYLSTDHQSGDVSCPQSQSMAGDFKMMMFDLLNDPNETTDVYGNPDLAEVQVGSQLIALCLVTNLHCSARCISTSLPLNRLWLCPLTTQTLRLSRPPGMPLGPSCSPGRRPPPLLPLVPTLASAPNQITSSLPLTQSLLKQLNKLLSVSLE